MEVPRGMEPTGTNGRTRHTLSDPLVGDWVSSCGGFLVGWQGTLFLVVTTTILVRRLSFASVVRFPDRHDRNRSCGWFRFCRPPVFRLAVLYWFCGGHGPGETPGPFPNPEAKAWHGDGTALERVWESSAPPHSTVWTFWSSPLRDSRKVPFFILLGVPAGRNAPETPIFCFSSGFFRAFTDLPATPFRLVEGVFPWLASLSFLRTSRPGIHDSPKGSSPIRGLPADAGRGRPVFLS